MLGSRREVFVEVVHLSELRGKGKGFGKEGPVAVRDEVYDDLVYWAKDVLELSDQQIRNIIIGIILSGRNAFVKHCDQPLNYASINDPEFLNVAFSHCADLITKKAAGSKYSVNPHH